MAAARRVADDTVRYYLFPKLAENANVKLQLEDKLESYTAKLFPLIASYIWQDEPFNLGVVEAQRDGMPPHLEGITYFGDNVEDEWFVVYLLQQLTKEDQDLVVKVEDSDGEFLLIEAADHLPKWLNPETSENRVYLYRGILHIIPKDGDAKSLDQASAPTVTEAVATLRSPAASTRAAPAAQRALSKRVEDQPEKQRQSLHRAHCFLPATAVAVLRRDPQILGPAVGAFVARDPLDLKALRAMRRVFLGGATRVMAEVLFTRCLYAQLRQQRFAPDRRVGWNLPPTHSPDFVAHDLGLKLACGLEILAVGANPAGDGDNPQDAAEAIVDDVRWKRFLKSLTAKGYFQGELEGSKLYRQLLQRAREHFVRTFAAGPSDAVDGCARGRLPAAARVAKLLRSVDVNVEKLREEARTLKPPDDERWMEIGPRDLDRLLESYASRGGGGDHKEAVDEEALGTRIADGVKNFVRHVSDYEGAELPSGAARRGKSGAAANGAKVDLDADGFADAVSAILGEILFFSADSDDHLEDSDDEEAPRPGDPSTLDMRSYMDLMDRELAGTDVGLSFEREPPARPPRRRPAQASDRSADDEEANEDDYRPVDVDLTALKNILESYGGQEGLPGPAGNLLSAMGIRVPRDADP
ncbi:SGT1 protein, putative [Ixodes scapularis]|uniref:SGT1 protein, putative n=1 Tax=Ixodes scapularis TaxID=6945 RepID=B7Q5U3_IXOSC|nr:SGT1 protein, putative [Ixodes scapularis]|eukprot:XP_002411815.1 SGT1 protein, putative [Ixodes scapularis]